MSVTRRPPAGGAGTEVSRGAEALGGQGDWPWAGEGPCCGGGRFGLFLCPWRSRGDRDGPGVKAAGSHSIDEVSERLPACRVSPLAANLRLQGTASGLGGGAANNLHV